MDLICKSPDDEKLNIFITISQTLKSKDIGCVASTFYQGLLHDSVAVGGPPKKGRDFKLFFLKCSFQLQNTCLFLL